MIGVLPERVKRPVDGGQKSPVSTSRTNAAALSQHNRASSTEPVAPIGPTATRYRITPRTSAMPALASRNRISLARLLTALDGPPALEGADQGHFVGILEVTPDRQAPSDPADDTDDRLEAFGQVHGGRLALERRVRGHDDLDQRCPLAGGRVGALEQLADAESVRADPVDRRDRAVEHVIEALELARPLEGEHVQRLLDDTEARLVTSRITADRTERRIADVE